MIHGQLVVYYFLTTTYRPTARPNPCLFCLPSSHNIIMSDTTNNALVKLLVAISDNTRAPFWYCELDTPDDNPDIIPEKTREKFNDTEFLDYQKKHFCFIQNVPSTLVGVKCRCRQIYNNVGSMQFGWCKEISMGICDVVKKVGVG